MRKIYSVVAVIAVFLCAGCNDGGVESGGSDAEAYLNVFRYDYVDLGGNKWMKKNLNVETADSWCYDNNPANCATYGRLYTWEAALMACQRIGWRLPDQDDWSALILAVGNERTAGTILRAKNGWLDCDIAGGGDCNGTDNYGFSALPGGQCISCGYNGYFVFAGNHGFWWTATDATSSHGVGVIMYSIGGVSDDLHADKSEGLSVRCVKD